MANVFDTAKYILERYGSMSAMKLQKLCPGYRISERRFTDCKLRKEAG